MIIISTVMKTKFQAAFVFFFGLIYFLCQASLSESQVILVTRNVTDSFHTGQDGCKGNENVCTDAQASCQDDGSCLCKNGYPNFRNPTKITRNGTVQYGDSYGCMDNVITPIRVGKISCKFRPYQVIPNDHQEPATTFTINDERPKICEYQSAEAKYPNNNTQINLPWLNETYIEFNNSGDDRTWYFKWTKSVPKLEGLIITIVFRCTSRSTATSNDCLQAKVFGTWRSSNLPTATPSIRPSSNLKSAMESSLHKTISPTRSYSFISSTKSILSSSRSQLCNCESSWTKSVAIALAVISAILLMINVSLIVGFLVFYRRLKRNHEQRTTSKEIQNHDTQNPPNSAYEEENYQGLQNNGRHDSDEHFYQGLVGVPRRGNNIPSTGDSLEMQYDDVQNSRNRDSEDPSQNYEPLNHTRRDTSPEQTYQGLVEAR